MIRNDFKICTQFNAGKTILENLTGELDATIIKYLVIKTSDKKYERRFDRSTVILKFKFTK